jgi:hypothetical protein
MVEKAEREKNLALVSNIGLSDTFNMVFATFVMFSGGVRPCERIPAQPV